MAAIKTIEQQQYQRKVYTVSELNRRCKQTLESQFSTIWLEAEISNLAMPASGHWYFSLKDQKAQVRCAMFKGKNRACKIPPEEGMKVLVRAKVSLFEPRGEFQLIVEYLEPAGAGELLRQYEVLKAKLESEGLFDVAYKQSISHSNKSIGVITSATGAAVHDVISVIRRRYPIQQLIIYPCMVQGAQAAEQIIHKILLANRRLEVDVLLLVRGGGSLEDLWCFNDENLARTIHMSQLPIVTGIGHETDFTIADYVADLRAPTPSAAAEKTTQDQRELMQQLLAYKQWQISFMQNKIQIYCQKVDWMSRQLQSPESIIASRSQQLQLLKLRLQSTQTSCRASLVERLQKVRFRLGQLNPTIRIETAKQKRLMLKHRLQQTIANNIVNNQSQFRELSIKLNSLSPLATIGRGYSVTKDATGQLITDATKVVVGDIIKSEVKTGMIESQVLKTQSEHDYQ